MTKEALTVEFYANEGKQVGIEADGKRYLRHAIHTHQIGVGEDCVELVRRYVTEIYRPGDILSISEKIVSLCQKRVIYKKDVHVGPLAKFLSRFAAHSTAGVGVDNPYKMQVAIDLCGRGKILYASVMAAIGKLFGRHGVFYEIAGKEVSGLDGFYSHAFKEYGEFGIMLPERPWEICDEIFRKLGVSCMIVDANDYGVEILGKSENIALPDQTLAEIIRDNPANNHREMTPFVLIRPAENIQWEQQEQKPPREPMIRPA